MTVLFEHSGKLQRYLDRLQTSEADGIWAATPDFQQWGILTSVDSDEPVQPPVKHRNSKWCSVSSLTVIEYSSDKQMLWSVCTYAQADPSLCSSQIPHFWKSHVTAHMEFNQVLQVSGYEVDLLKVSVYCMHRCWRLSSAPGTLRWISPAKSVGKLMWTESKPRQTGHSDLWSKSP